MKVTEYSKILTSENLTLIEMEIMQDVIFLCMQEVGEEKFISFFFDAITEKLIAKLED